MNLLPPPLEWKIMLFAKKIILEKDINIQTQNLREKKQKKQLDSPSNCCNIYVAFPPKGRKFSK